MPMVIEQEIRTTSSVEGLISKFYSHTQKIKMRYRLLRIDQNKMSCNEMDNKLKVKAPNADPNHQWELGKINLSL